MKLTKENLYFDVPILLLGGMLSYFLDSYEMVLGAAVFAVVVRNLLKR